MTEGRYSFTFTRFGCGCAYQTLGDVAIRCPSHGDEDCSYRWCGKTEGLHAYWRLHARGASEQATGLTEDDIFNHGPARDRPEDETAALQKEQADLDGMGEELLSEMVARRNTGPTATPDAEDHEPTGEPEPPRPYDLEWLQQSYDVMAKQSEMPVVRRIAKVQLKEKLVRLHVAGFPGPQPEDRQGPKTEQPQQDQDRMQENGR